MRPLIDGDILCYEIGFAAETAWAAINPGEDPTSSPPWELVNFMLHERLDAICASVWHRLRGDKETPLIFLSGPTNFRNDIATVKPYKGTRKSVKPWHYNNIKVYLTGCFNTMVSDGMEADDNMATFHIFNTDTCICSRDKDLRQVPGWFYSWELGKQAALGPMMIDRHGSISLSNDRKKIEGTGLSFFYSQVLTGDVVDNIPGLPRCGPVAAYDILTGSPEQKMLNMVYAAYLDYYGVDDCAERLTEQGRLCWMTRQVNIDGTPKLWEIGMEE